jgi:hypothetical protein
MTFSHAEKSRADRRFLAAAGRIRAFQSRFSAMGKGLQPRDSHPADTLTSGTEK